MSKSNPQKNHKNIGRLSLQALTWLRDRQIPAFPVAYAVGFEYIRNSIEELVSYIDELEPQQELDDEVINQLFREFILSKYLDLDGFNRDMSDIVEDTSKAITDARAPLKEFKQFLDKTEQSLSSGKEVKARDLVKELSQKTEKTAESVSELENHLSVISADVQILRKQYLKVLRESRQDPLTGLLNRAALQKRFSFLKSDANVENLTLCVADIDLFKNFNDRHGHSVGDKVIRLVANTLQTNLKGSDVLSRYGGEEFVILLPNTALKDGISIMNKIRSEIANKEFKNKNDGQSVSNITMSFGLSEIKDDDNFHSLFDRADKALYRSKQNGRNRVSSEC